MKRIKRKKITGCPGNASLIIYQYVSHFEDDFIQDKFFSSTFPFRIDITFYLKESRHLIEVKLRVSIFILQSYFGKIKILTLGYKN